MRIGAISVFAVASFLATSPAAAAIGSIEIPLLFSCRPLVFFEAWTAQCKILFPQHAQNVSVSMDAWKERNGARALKVQEACDAKVSTQGGPDELAKMRKYMEEIQDNVLRELNSEPDCTNLPVLLDGTARNLDDIVIPKELLPK